jgi:hypothetical protein
MRWKVQVLRSFGGYTVVITDYELLSARKLPTVRVHYIGVDEVHSDRIEEVLSYLACDMQEA